MKFNLNEVDSLSETEAQKEYVDLKLKEHIDKKVLTPEEVEYLEKVTQRLIDLTEDLPEGINNGFGDGDRYPDINKINKVRPGYFARLLKIGANSRRSSEENAGIKKCTCDSRDLFNNGCSCGGQ